MAQVINCWLVNLLDVFPCNAVLPGNAEMKCAGRQSSACRPEKCQQKNLTNPFTSGFISISCDME
ncbi:hypothetical protein [Noviherbaspirillum sp.]|uniref:hypothetical protein n=1 Tax=Noviherbaspirillum sp. TaxID=1926288 RepID=UPI002FE35E61